jgi:hypothetical protein
MLSLESFAAIAGVTTVITMLVGGMTFSSSRTFGFFQSLAAFVPAVAYGALCIFRMNLYDGFISLLWFLGAIVWFLGARKKQENKEGNL